MNPKTLTTAPSRQPWSCLVCLQGPTGNHSAPKRCESKQQTRTHYRTCDSMAQAIPQLKRLQYIPRSYPDTCPIITTTEVRLATAHKIVHRKHKHTSASAVASCALFAALTPMQYSPSRLPCASQLSATSICNVSCFSVLVIAFGAWVPSTVCLPMAWFRIHMPDIAPAPCSLLFSA